MSIGATGGSPLIPLSKSQERRLAAQLETAPMKLGRVWLVELVTARPGNEQLPFGFAPAWGGSAGLRITAYDRDRLGEKCSAMDLAAFLVHPGPGPHPGFRPDERAQSSPAEEALP
jgi:hypothetical protein